MTRETYITCVAVAETLPGVEPTLRVATYMLGQQRINHREKGKNIVHSEESTTFTFRGTQSIYAIRGGNFF
jgi:hypothetical protein